MAKQTINLGTVPSGVGGDTPRSAWVKAKANMDELYRFNALDEAPVFTGNIDDGSAVPLGQCMVNASTGGTKPAGLSFGILITWGAVAQQGRVQKFYEITGATEATLRVFYRNNYAASGASAFGPWRMLYAQNNVVGPVSQVLGDPTGAIIETGTNANGTYTKFADGTLIVKGFIANFSASANGVTGITCTFPAAFVDANYSISPFASPATSGDVYGFTYSNNKAPASILLFYRNGATAQIISIGSYMAVGRWF